jgi:hypothetical protein
MFGLKEQNQRRKSKMIGIVNTGFEFPNFPGEKFPTLA